MKRILLISFVLMASLISGAWAQRTVSGTVTSAADGEGLPGVAVRVKGTTTGVTTDFDGNYRLSVPEGENTLVFSFVGYETVEETIGNRSVIDVTLQEDVQQLEEVVVTALGLERDRDKFGSAASKVEGASVARSGEATLINGLAGKASGVNVVRSSGDPGAGSYIQIRGQSTITGNLQPLVIIDGVPMSNSTVGSDIDGVTQQSRLNDLNPDDIASMEVLKGASAAALWGSRAANGVIVITTKRGADSGGKINIALKSTVSFDQLYKTQPLQNTYGQGFNGRYIFGQANSWGDRIADRTGGEDEQITDPNAEGYNGYFEGPDGERVYVIPSGTADDPHGGKNSRETYDYRDYLFKTGYFLDNSVTLSGGDENGNFYLSLSNLNQEGIIQENSDYNRTTIKASAERKFSDLVRLSTSANYSRIGSNRVQMGSNTSGLYLGGLRTAPDFNPYPYEGTYVAPSGLVFPNRQRAYRNPIGASEASVYDNPLWMMNNILNNTQVDRIVGKVEANITPTDWFRLVARVGLDNYTDRREGFFPVLASANRGGLLSMETIRETQIDGNFFGNFFFDINDAFSLDAIVGFNMNSRVFDNVGGEARNFIIQQNVPRDLTNAENENRNPFNAFSEIRTAAVYSTATFGFADQLFLTLTGRAESASTFGRAAESTFFYPAADLAWQFSDLLPDLTETGVLSFGKLRASYGQVGVQPGPYLTSTYFVTGGYADSWGSELNAGAYGGGYAQSTVRGNAELRPERKTEFEIGTDLRFFDNRLSLSGTYFNNETTDAILSVALAPSTGFQSQTGNSASIENYGWEVDLGVDVVRSQAFTWNVNANWTYYRNMVTSLSGTNSLFLAGFTGVSSRAVEGYPLGVLWGVDWARDENNELILNDNGFPMAASEESVIGNPNPDWKSGIGNRFTFFEDLSLYVLFDIQQGGDIWGGTRGALATFGRPEYTANESVAPEGGLVTYGGDVIPAGTTFRGNIEDFGDGPVALDQSWYNSLGGGFGPVGSQFIEDASWRRIREVTLAYNLNSEGFRQTTGLQSVDFSLTGRNLFIWSDFIGNDPETNLTGASNGRGLDYFNNPSTRSYLFTVRITY